MIVVGTMDIYILSVSLRYMKITIHCLSIIIIFDKINISETLYNIIYITNQLVIKVHYSDDCTCDIH